MKCVLSLALLFTLAAGTTRAQGNIQTKKDIEYAVHDGASLKGDLYLPSSAGVHPAMVFIHGGGFRGGSKAGYGNSWGPYLAARGYVVFAIDYRLATPTQPTWPQALLDCKAAVQYLRGNAPELSIDPERIGVGGDSAGASLAALVAVTQDSPQFANRYPKDANNSASTKVKVAVPIYGVLDLMAWHKYTSGQSNGATPANNANPVELYIGGAPNKMFGLYYEASPLSYIRQASTKLGSAATPNAGVKISWFLAWGMVDPVVPPADQSVPFVQALRDAGASVTTVTVPNMGHFWFTASLLTGKKGEPVCADATPGKFACEGATPNDFIRSQLLDFLTHNL